MANIAKGTRTKAQRDAGMSITQARAANSASAPPAPKSGGGSSTPTAPPSTNQGTGQEASETPVTTPAPSTTGGSTGTGTETKESSPTYVPRYTSPAPYTPIETPSADQLQRRKVREAQGEINALRDYEQTLLKEQAVLNDKDERSVASVNTLTGLGGSTEANENTRTAVQRSQQANRVITDTIQTQVQGILSQIRKDAVTEARQARIDARDDETAYLANQATKREQAKEYVKGLSAAGVTNEGLKKTDPEAYQYLIDVYGGEDAVRGAFVLNAPQDQIVDKQIKGGSYVIARQNPITGAIKIETVDLGLPDDYSASVDLGDRIMFYDPADPQNKQLFVSKGLTPEQESELIPTEQEAKDAQDQKNEALTIALELLSDDAVGKSSAVGASLAKLVPFGKETGLQGNRAAFEARVETLKSKLTRENLDMLKGAMSDKDLAFLNAIGSSLDVNMSETEFDKELQRIADKLIENGAESPIANKRIIEQAGYDYEAIKADYPDKSDDEILEELGLRKQSFNSVGNTTASGNRPQRNNNPGNVKIGGIGDRFALKGRNGKPMTDEQGHLIFPDPQSGLAALRADIDAKISGRSDAAQRKLGKQAETIAELNQVYAEDPNWKNNVVAFLREQGVPASIQTSLKSVPKEKLIEAIMRSEGYYA